MPMLNSPRMDAMQGANQGMPGDQAKSLFDQGLSQMAYNVLINKLPNISPDVVTFKVLDSDPEEGQGVGAFVVQRNSQLLYIPVVMADNQVKPLDILYFKDLNVFLPLTKEWLEEIDKMSLGELGQGMTPPKTLNSDVDIRNVVVPPTTGRYSYAAENDMVKQAGRVFDEARVQVDPPPAFLSFLDKAPNRVKRAAARFFETQPKLLKTAVWHYGKDALVGALRLTQEKVAAESELSRSGGLYVASKKTPTSKFKEIWGDQSGVAFQGVLVKGYYAKDDRKKHKHAVKTQNELHLTEPKDAGAYRLWKRDGTEVMAFIINGPKDFFSDHGALGRYSSNESWKKPRTPKEYIGVTTDGKLIDAHCLVGEPLPVGELSGNIFKALEDKSSAGPKVGQWGIWVHREGAGGFTGTMPMKIRTITTVDGVKRIEVSRNEWEDAEKKLLVFDGSQRTMHAKGSHVYHLSRDWKWVSVGSGSYSERLRERDFITEPRDVLNLTTAGLTKHGAERVLVKKSNHGYTFGDQPKVAYDFVSALEKLARDAQIKVDDAEAALKTASEKGRFEFYVIGSEGLAKFAAESGGGDKKPAADPAEDAMNQVMMAQMQQPQGPSPVEMAVAEQLQNLQGQMLAIQQQQQMLANLQTRAQMIAGGGGAAAAPGAAAAAMAGPMDPSMMGAGAPVDPSGQMGAMQGQPPMDPSMAGGMAAPPAPQGFPGMQPQMPPGPTGTGMQMPQQGAPPPGMGGGQAPQQMAPGMQPGMDPGMDPNQPPPQASMTSEDGSIESILNQVNPQFMEQAGQLNDTGAFDAAALASMAQTPQLKDMVSTYIPNLEKSLDNIGRVLLTLWMDESKIKEDIGDETYIGLEDNLRTVFKGLGQLILKINSNTAVLRADNGMAEQ